jgi:hypothetical protein
MKHARYRALATTVVLAVAVDANDASAQLLDPTNARCANAYGVTTTQAQARYAWALYCRNNPGTRPPTNYLTDASIDAYNNASASLKPYLFPTYYDFIFAGTWDVPNGAGTNCALLPASAIHAGLCIAGCYDENTNLRFADGEMGIKAAFQAGKFDLVTLAETATLDNLQFTENRVSSYTVDMFEDWQDIYTLTMKSGGTLRVTSEHPLLTSDGVMQQAQNLKAKDELIREDGSFDPIVKIKTEKVFGKVYNVKPVTGDYTSNIVIADGYLNGSQRYQNEFLHTINSLILRRALTEQADQLTSTSK